MGVHHNSQEHISNVNKNMLAIQVIAYEEGWKGTARTAANASVEWNALFKMNLVEKRFGEMRWNRDCLLEIRRDCKIDKKSYWRGKWKSVSLDLQLSYFYCSFITSVINRNFIKIGANICYVVIARFHSFPFVWFAITIGRSDVRFVSFSSLGKHWIRELRKVLYKFISMLERKRSERSNTHFTTTIITLAHTKNTELPYRKRGTAFENKFFRLTEPVSPSSRRF